VVRFGKIGATGQTTRKDFADAEAAEGEAAKLIGQKVKKGYVETPSP
jgi:predicted DNA-binding WGR domain protein